MGDMERGFHPWDFLPWSEYTKNVLSTLLSRGTGVIIKSKSSSRKNCPHEVAYLVTYN